MPIPRRTFLVGCNAAIAAMAGGRLGRVALAGPSGGAQHDILVLISLRGGIDGLHFLAPVDDPHYIAARSPTTRILDGGTQAGLRVDNALPGGDFRLHPAATGLKELYDSGDLAIVHACGLTDGTRSHFAAMELMERGVGGGALPRDGWLARYVEEIGAQGLLPAVAATASLPIALGSSRHALAIPEPTEFRIHGSWRYGEQQRQALGTLYRGDAPLHHAGARTLEALRAVATGLPRDSHGEVLAYEPEHGAEYPTDYHVEALSRALQAVARLIKLDLGVQVATVDYGGWDTHEGQAEIFPALVDGLSRAVHAFYNDMARHHQRLTVVVLSEFGRRVQANQSGGTDHGFGNVLLLLGGAVNGGRVYGRWPGLATEQLDDGADLAITTDYRAVLGEVLARRMGVPTLNTIFPGYTPGTALGIVR